MKISSAVFFLNLLILPYLYAQPLKENDLSEVLPHADVFIRVEQPVPCYIGYTRDQLELAGIAFITTEVCPEETWGYKSRISTLVGVNPEGKIVGIKILSEDESSKYTRGLRDSWFIKQFIGKDSNDDFILHRDIDAITGATITSNAITRSVEAVVRIASTAVLNLENIRTESVIEHVFWDHILWQLDLLILFIIIGLAIFAYGKNDRLMRYFVLVLTVSYIGFLKGGGFSMNDVLSISFVNFPIFINSLYWYSLLFTVVLSIIFAGRFYCGWFCPFGAFIELLHSFCTVKILVPDSLDRWLRSVKYVNLLVILFIAVIIGRPEIANTVIAVIEPFGTFFRLSGNLLMWLWLILVIIFSFFISRAYCKFFCPLGAFFALLAILVSFIKRIVLKIKLPEKCYKGLGFGIERCPMGAIKYVRDFKELKIDNNECINCNKCK